MSTGIFPIDGVSFLQVLVALMCPGVDIFLIHLVLASYLMLWKQAEASRLTPKSIFMIESQMVCKCIQSSQSSQKCYR